MAAAAGERGHQPDGSDWPVAEIGGGYAKVRAELSRLFDQLSPAGRDAILGGTATRFYALGS